MCRPQTGPGARAPAPAPGPFQPVPSDAPNRRSGSIASVPSAPVAASHVAF
jgi:hypothetical protein